MGGEGGGEERRERRYRAVHQPSQTGLNDLEHEQALPGRRLSFQRTGRPLRALEFFGQAGVLTLLTRQITEQLTGARIGGLPRGSLVEPPGLQLHQLDLLADGR